MQTQSLIDSWEQLGRDWNLSNKPVNGFLSPQWQEPVLAAVAIALQAAACRKSPDLVIEEVVEERQPDPLVESLVIEETPAEEPAVQEVQELAPTVVAVPKVVDYRSATGLFFSQLPWSQESAVESAQVLPQETQAGPAIQWTTGEFFKQLPWSAEAKPHMTLAAKIGSLNVMQLATESAIAAAKRHKTAARSPFSGPKKNTVGEFFSSLPWSQPVKGHS